MRSVILRSLMCTCLVVMVANCSSSDGTTETSASYVSIDGTDQGNSDQGNSDQAPVDTTAHQTASAVTASDAAADNEIDRIVSAFDTFLSLRAQAITGDLELGDLDAVATPQAIDQVAQLRSANDDLIARDSYAALSDLIEWSNVTSIAQNERVFTFTDCTERQFVTPGGTTVVRFVTNNVSMIDSNGAYLVEAVIETQNGSLALEPDEFGCVPPSFSERAEQTAALAVRQASLLIADPRAALATELPEIFRDDARAGLERVLETLNLEGLSRAADEIVDLTVLGIDVNRPEFTVVVSVCRTYPQGRTFTDVNGEPTVTDLPIGSSYEEWLYVQLDPAPSGTTAADTATAIEDRGPNCQEG